MLPKRGPPPKGYPQRRIPKGHSLEEFPKESPRMEHSGLDLGKNDIKAYCNWFNTNVSWAFLHYWEVS